MISIRIRVIQYQTSAIYPYKFQIPFACDSNTLKLFLYRQAAAAEWLIQELQTSMRVGADPKFVPNSEWEPVGRAIATKSIILIPVVANLVDLIWPTEERPVTPNMDAYVWLEEYAG